MAFAKNQNGICGKGRCVSFDRNAVEMGDNMCKIYGRISFVAEKLYNVTIFYFKCKVIKLRFKFPIEGTAKPVLS